MKEADIIIIGAGAAGLMAAAGAAEGGHKVLVMEKMPRPGRKIMITGKGRCNFTNLKPWNEFSVHIHPKPNFLKPAFHNLTPEKLIPMLAGHGMESVVERGDRVFPKSHRSAEVVDTMVRAAGNAGAEILCNKDVTAVMSGRDGTYFTLECSDGSTYSCRKLIICTGGLSYPATGSTGDGYRFAGGFGHKVSRLFPSLTAIVPINYKAGDDKCHIDRSTPLSEYGKLLCGNQLKNINLTVIIDGNIAQEEFGDLDFTDGGMEGPIGFKVSRKCVNALINGSKVTAVLDLKPAVEPEELKERIIRLWEEISKDRRHALKQYRERFKLLLGRLMPMSLIPAFVKANPNADHKTLAKALKGWKFEISGYVGYERCVITAGGVSCEEITAKTLESKLVPGLYFAGEILDIDADTGGYNLHTAFSTGYLAGVSAAKSLE